ncbi:uncharacterized protein E0L32_006315 [Thyridium curvatum]|uniref:Fatty acid hydroxylase domain-containing protein n=1 Tax=Thyridium curvatum TaxID=1093900 RepID=A0A507ATM9_9PEZI|nr:uncharacterized protein E0L32_006315 [Thyridium curvatum]TPX13342.1 hypothetical protein E0L32_006315 [Thyridium curvatum]
MTFTSVFAGLHLPDHHANTTAADGGVQIAAGLAPALPSGPSPSSLALPVSVYAWAAQQVVYHAVGLLFEECDRKGALKRFKVRDVDRKHYADLLPRVLFNQLFVLLPSMVAAETLLALCFVGRQLQWWHYALVPPAMAVGHDVVQYLAHRYLLHQPNVALMRALRHSVHHSTGATKAVSACYMSAPDFFLEIVLPYLVPLALVGGGGDNVYFHSLVAGLGAVGGLYEHSGYDFSVVLRSYSCHGHGDGSTAAKWPRLASILGSFLDNRSHTEHHVRAHVSFSDGFGSPGICDTVMGTRWDLAAARRRAEAAEREWQRQQAKLDLAVKATGVQAK